ncbi:hypothetical protein HLB35_15570 [Halomonas sp. TBZ9]|uniref:Uncharacterized protein n=1 Tax=Vreelandella azerica TaxID=2732867 RepID=A0A7Y3XBX9_9GAMM|nr:hypothetical protein [Halomonas azerica]NOG32818.1 hypothetical protein [Halomonas azerica]
MSISDIKDYFFLLGSIAGLIALLRPVLESKFERDRKRAEKILEIVPEEHMKAMDFDVYQARAVLTSNFYPLDRLKSEWKDGTDLVRFSGPLKAHYLKEVEQIIRNYNQLREYIQVPYWEPTSTGDDNSDALQWSFNKSYFPEPTGSKGDYNVHLSEAGELVGKIRDGLRRLQIIMEMHFLEAFFARFLLPKRLRKVELEDA